MDIPAQYQLLVALVIGVLVAVGAVYRFFKEFRTPPADRGASIAPDELRILGAALGDSQAIGELVDELRGIRAVLERAVERDRSAELVQAVTRLADGITAYRPPPPPAPRRRGRA